MPSFAMSMNDWMASFPPAHADFANCQNKAAIMVSFHGVFELNGRKEKKG